MSLSTYLTQRGKNGTWQLRVPVPRPYRRRHGGPAERVCSLRTSDRRAAEKAALPILAGWQADWAAPVGAPSPLAADRPSAAQLAVEVHNQLLDRLEADRRLLADDDAAHDAALAKRQAELRRLSRRFHDGALDHWHAVAEKVIAKHGLAISRDSAEFDELVRTIAEAGIEAIAVFTRRQSGELNPKPQGKLFEEARERKANTAPAGETILELFDRYAAQRRAEKRKRADTLNQDRKIIEQFAEFVGKDRSVRSITDTDVRDWIDTMAVLPPNHGKRAEYRGLSLREAAEKARTDGGKGRSLTTLNKYLSTVSPLFKWLTKRNYYSGRNPCDGLFNDVPKGSNPRPPFTTEQLNTILKSPLFTGFLRGGREHELGSTLADDWRYWIPLICLFTGARIGEIAQLRVEDVQREQGIWFIHIRADEATGQTTKSGYSRPAPVHPILEAIGFLGFVERQRKRAERDGNPQMFPELKPNMRGHMSGTPSRFWRDYLNAIGVKDGGDGFGAHSFRHTMADRLREEVGLLDDQIEVALGHNQKTVTAGYGRVRQGTVKVLHDMISAVKFEGVQFDHLISSAQAAPNAVKAD